MTIIGTIKCSECGYTDFCDSLLSQDEINSWLCSNCEKRLCNKNRQKMEAFIKKEADKQAKATGTATLTAGKGIKLGGTPEMVNHPAHYQSRTGLEVIDVISAFSLDFLRGNAVKYILRADKKGNPVQDIEKAIWYLNKLLQELSKEKSN